MEFDEIIVIVISAVRHLLLLHYYWLEIWGVNGQTTWCTGTVSVVLRLRLVSGWGLRKRRSAPPHGP